MKKTLMIIGFIVMVCLLAAWPNTARAQGGFELVTGDAFTRAVPADFYLEGNHIPVEKRNDAVLKNAKGARVVLGLIDTTGYSSQIQQKYIGMLISEPRSPSAVMRSAWAATAWGWNAPPPPAAPTPLSGYITKQARRWANAPPRKTTALSNPSRWR